MRLSENQEGFFPGGSACKLTNTGVECDELSALQMSQGQQLKVGDLAVTDQPLAVAFAEFSQIDRHRPEVVMG